MPRCKKLVKDILTGIDGITYDNGRVMCTMSFFVYFMLAAWAAKDGHAWNPLDFSGGVCAMAVGFGVNIRLKSETEPR